MNHLNYPQQSHSVKNKVAGKEASLVFLGLLALSILIKLPSFFRYYDLADEATFILMAQSILDGHLPYTELWEIKPPMGFFIFTLPIILFGKSLVFVRLYSSVYIALAGLAVYIFGKKIWNHRTGIISAILLTGVVALGTSPGNVMEMTTLQQIALAPLTASLTIIATSRITPKRCFITGLLMGLAVMMRLNLAYVGLLAGFAILFIVLKQSSFSLKDSIKCLVAYGMGNVLIVFLNYVPYLITGYHQLWWDSVVLASLSYSNTDLSMLGAGAAQARYLLNALSHWSHTGINFLVWVGGFGGIITLLLRWKSLTKNQRIATEFLLVFLIATEISILRGGRSFSSYHMQLYPFLSLTSGVLLDFALSQSKITRITRSLVFATLLFSILGILPLLVSEYQVLVSRITSEKSPIHGVSYEIAEYLKQEKYSGEPIFMLNSHIVYWLLNTKPLSKSAQPYNITNPNILKFMAGSNATAASELAKILAQEPKYIIAKGGFKGKPGIMFKETLKKDYELVKKVHVIKIYRRKV